MKKDDIERKAYFSDCGKFRFMLTRVWDKELPGVMFIGLNPSTANAEKDDATIRRVISLSKSFGFGYVFMCNLFPFISTDPAKLDSFENIEINDRWLKNGASDCTDVIFSWGSFEVAKARSKTVEKMFPDAFALIKNKDGSPRHPLYVPNKIIPVKYAL